MASSSYAGMVFPYTDGVNFGCYICPVPPRERYEEPSRRVRENEAKKVKDKKIKDPRSLTSTTTKAPFSKPSKGKKESPQETGGLQEEESSTYTSSTKTLKKRPSKVKTSVGRLVSCFASSRVEGEEA